MKLTKFNPSDDYTFKIVADGIKYDINCHRVARIIKFYPDTITADVKIIAKFKLQGITQDYVIIPDVPVCINGTPNSHITFGDLTGAEGLLHVNDENIDAWFETGVEYAPNTIRLHNLSDCFIDVGVNSLPNVFSYDITQAVFKYGSTSIKMNGYKVEIDNGSAKITLEGDKVTISKNIEVEMNTTTLGNTDSLTYSTGGLLGVSGSFATADSKTVTVTNGIITGIS